MSEGVSVEVVVQGPVFVVVSHEPQLSTRAHRGHVRPIIAEDVLVTQ